MSQALTVFLPWRGGERRQAEKPSLQEMQTFVEGYIETCRIRFEGRWGTMVVNEEGIIRGLPANPQATKLVKDMACYLKAYQAQTIVGNAIILLGYRV